MKKLLPVAAVLAGLSLHASAQNVDMAVAQKWANAKVIKYRVEGVHKARVPVVLGDYEGKADVTDRVTVEFTGDIKQRKIVGAVALTDAKTEIANLKSDGTNCPPPTLNAPYEHFQSVSNSMMGDLIQVKGIRTYPPASVSNYPGSCSMRAVPGGKQEVTLHVGSGVDPQALAMPNMPGSPVTIAADRKSFTMRGAENWLWTYTPTLVQ
jgi:hypothetical protein